ncbi:hypothetical protein F994_02770 [Acinetobacter bohemicus ANC 3994]|uniref:Uncharacterized protein n=1 Tax=Acinetobacter bohemicus ANC 3994 TaxID=1217715 RepID=N8Q627_9GAMM|nr:hypothetical protein [Acinetobacter bohemicus]ENU18643.1 hypothetical protein F994_02770 [Acinetobacter bohemicus ANC 3994]
MDKKRLKSALSRDLDNQVYDETEEGIYFPRHGVMASGEYFDRINGGEWQRTPNLITKEGRIDAINTYIGSKAKPVGFYLALFSGAAAPADNWTAANFATVASEIVSLSEGYTLPTRAQFISTNATVDTFIDNMANVARLTIATASQLNVTGTALLTNSARGGTTGVLVSATKYPAARTFQDGDTYDVGYRFALTS